MSKATRKVSTPKSTPKPPAAHGNAGGNKVGPPGTRPFGKGELDYKP